MGVYTGGGGRVGLGKTFIFNIFVRVGRRNEVKLTSLFIKELIIKPSLGVSSFKFTNSLAVYFFVYIVIFKDILTNGNAVENTKLYIKFKS